MSAAIQIPKVEKPKNHNSAVGWDWRDSLSREELQDHERGVAVDIAHRAADDHRVGGGREEGEQAEGEGAHPEDGLSELVAELEAIDLEEHRQLAFGTVASPLWNRALK